MSQLWLFCVIIGLGSVSADCDCRQVSELSDQVTELRSILRIHAEWFRQQQQQQQDQEESSGRSAAGAAAKRQNVIMDQMKLLLGDLNAEVATLRRDRLPELEERMGSLESERSGRSHRHHGAMEKMQESINDLKEETFLVKETLNVFSDAVFAPDRRGLPPPPPPPDAVNATALRMSRLEETVERLVEQLAIVSEVKLQRLESTLKRVETQHKQKQQQQQQQQTEFTRLDRFIFEQMKVLLTKLNEKMTDLLQKRIPQLESAAGITTGS